MRASIGSRAKNLAEVGEAAKRLRAAGAACGFTTSWPSWINVENFSAFHQSADLDRGQRLRRAGCGADIQQSTSGAPHRPAREWQTTKAFDYSGRAQAAEPRFQNGECGIFIGSSATRADIKANSNSRSATACCRTGRTSPARRKTHHRRRDLWVLRDRRAMNTRASQNSSASCRSRKFRLLAPEHRLSPGDARRVRPDSHARFLRAQPRHFDLDRGDHAEAADREFQGVRLGSFVLIRDVIDDELEQAFSGKNRRKQHSIPRSSAGNSCFVSSSARARSGNEGARAPRCVRQIQTSFSAVRSPPSWPVLSTPRGSISNSFTSCSA